MNNTTTRISNKELWGAITAVLSAAESNGLTLDMGEITYEKLHEFVNKSVAQLDKKAEKAKERAAQKKKDGDMLRDRIYGVLTDEFATIPQIVEKLGDPNVSPQMTTSRLTQLCSEDVGLAIKEMVSVAGPDGKNKKLSAYKRA